MLSRQEEMLERQRVFAQDQSLRNASTFHQFAQADAQTPRGRFSQVDASTVVGAQPFTNYPAAAAHQHDPAHYCQQCAHKRRQIDLTQRTFKTVKG